MLSSCFKHSPRSHAQQGNFTPLISRLARASGFTLIELMFVVAIVAILLALAYPSYVDQVRKARRADATSSLMDWAQSMERCFTRFNAYDDDNCPNPEDSDFDDTEEHYTITFGDGEPTTTTYLLIATPKGDQVNDLCGTFTMNYLGNKTPVPGSNRCWGSLGSS